MKYEVIKQNYDHGLWNARQVEMCVKKGAITEAQRDEILYPEKEEANENLSRRALYGSD